MDGYAVASTAILDSLAGICMLVCFRAVPFTGFVAVAKRTGLATKLVTLASFLALAVLSLQVAPNSRAALLALPVVYAYLGAVALLLPALARAVRDGWIARTFPSPSGCS